MTGEDTAADLRAPTVDRLDPGGNDHLASSHLRHLTQQFPLHSHPPLSFLYPDASRTSDPIDKSVDPLLREKLNRDHHRRDSERRELLSGP